LIWKRNLKLSKNQFNIQDSLLGSGSYTMRAYFHFDNKIIVNTERENIFNIQLPNKITQFKLDIEKSFTINKYYGGDSPLGWQCLSYGNRLPAYTLEVVKTVKLPEVISYSMELS